MDQKRRQTDGSPKSIVTQDQFWKLVTRVQKLQQIHNIENLEPFQHMSGFQKKLSMTDPMALIQLSARLEQAERNVLNMTALLTELANRKPSEPAVESVSTPIVSNISRKTISLDAVHTLPRSDSTSSLTSLEPKPFLTSQVNNIFNYL